MKLLLVDLEEELRRIWRMAQRYASGPCSCDGGRCLAQCVDGKVLVDFRTAEGRGEVPMWTSFLSTACDEPLDATLASWRSKMAALPGCVEAIFEDCPTCGGSGTCQVCGGELRVEISEYHDVVVGTTAIALVDAMGAWARAGDFHRVAWASEWFRANLIQPTIGLAEPELLERSLAKLAEARDHVLEEDAATRIHLVGERITEEEIDRLLAEKD